LYIVEIRYLRAVPRREEQRPAAQDQWEGERLVRGQSYPPLRMIQGHRGDTQLLDMSSLNMSNERLGYDVLRQQGGSSWNNTVSLIFNTAYTI